jgi:hypothetical protein
MRAVVTVADRSNRCWQQGFNRSNHINGSDKGISQNLVVGIGCTQKLANVPMVGIHASDLLVVVAQRRGMPFNDNSIGYASSTNRKGLIERPQAKVWCQMPEGVIYG